MDETRFERLESRLSALETEVRRLSGASAAASAPVPEAAAHATAQAKAAAEIANLGGEPASVADAQAIPRVAVLWRKGTLEDLIAGRGLQVAGLLFVLFGAALFLDLAFTRGWVGPVERILLGLATGSGIMFFAATRLRETYRVLAESLIGLGSGILYLSIWASVASFPELHVSRTAAFLAMIAVTAVLGALSGVRRSQPIAVLGTLGGFLTPALLAGGEPDRAILAAYLVTLSAGMLAVARRYNFAIPEVLVLLGALAYASTFAPAGQWTAVAAEIVAVVFFAVFAAAFTLGPPPAGNALKRRVALLAIDAAAFAYALSQIFADDQYVLGYNLLGLAAILLGIAQVRNLRGPLARTYGYLGLSAVTLALPALLQHATLTDALTVEGGLLVAIGLRADKWIARAGAGLLFLTGFGVLIDAGFAVTEAFVSVNALEANIAFALWVAASAYALYSLKALIPGDTNAFFRGIARVYFDVVTVVGLSGVCLQVFGPWSWDDLGGVRNSHLEFATSIVWILYATGLFGYGLQRKIGALRWEALCLFGITILKVFSIDLASVDLEFRIGLFVILGIVLFGVSAWYTRSMAKAPAGGPK